MKKKLICFGDSITAGWDGMNEQSSLTNRLERGLGWHVWNAGVPGETTEQALSRMNRDVLSRHYDWVTILFGANDSSFHKGIPLEAFTANLINMARAIGAGQAVLITPSPVIEAKQKGKRINERLSLYADAVRHVVEETGSSLIDLYRLMLQEPDYTPMLLDDGLHFSSAGYDFLAERIILKIRGLENRDQ